jgi:hypothetical protein
MKALCNLVFFSLIVSNLCAQGSFRVGDTIRCPFNTAYSHFNNAARGVTPKTSNSRKKNDPSIFEVKYTGFTPDARLVFEKAISIWDAYLDSKIKIRVLAQWSVSSNSNNLGFVVPSEVKDFEGAPLKNTWYPLSLAEKLAETELNGSGEIDIVANFNSGRNDWYFGVDGNCPADKFDLLTVVLHELGHGLGISGTFFKNGAIGTFGINGLPKVYDLFVINGAGQQLINQSIYPNGSSALGDQLTNNSLEFNSLIATLFNIPNGVPRLYAPNPYNPGSSISHLDQSYNLTNNGLMTPFATLGKVNHTPGPLIKGILYEMGWLHTFLNHIEIRDKESLSDADFLLQVSSDTVFLTGDVTLSYKDKVSGFQNKLMNTVDSTNFTSVLSDLATESTIEYYFTVTDVLNRKYRLPIDPSTNFSFYYGVDVIKPTIIHTQNVFEVNRFEEQVTISSIVTDNLGINTVTIFVKVNGVVKTTIQMQLKINSLTEYEAVINLNNLNLVDGDILSYMIQAEDKASISNIGTLPAAGEYTITVKAFPERGAYVSNFNASSIDFFGEYDIKTITGFQNGAMHSVHPYSTGSPSAPIDMTHTLLYPVRVSQQNPFIQFEEVVLVKPGTGSNYLLDLFGDYVIVEGSNDGGNTWLPMIDGYNSSANSIWLDYFNSNVLGGNSRAVGTLNYYITRTIDISDTFSPGHLLYVRFRLRSRSGFNGWGWAIDNLKIQDQILEFEELIIKDATIYPNPAINVLVVNNSNHEYQLFELFSLNGYKLFIHQLEIGINNIEISNIPPGVYVSRLKGRSGVERLSRIVKIE